MRSKAPTPSFVAAAPPLGIALDRSATGSVRKLKTTHPLFVLPLAPSVIAFTTPGFTNETLDASNWLLVPQGVSLRLETRSSQATTALLTPYPELEATMAKTYAGEVDDASMRRVLATTVVIPRTKWVSELVHRYAFEREVCHKSNNVATSFLETEILKEWYFVRRDAETNASPRFRRSHLAKDAPLLARATAYIDEHLSGPITVEAIAKAVHASPSAVLRTFRAELGIAPASYVRARRLDAALVLLREGQLGVGEVAAQVGYGAVAAFSSAFRARFGEPPSAFVGAR